MPVLKNPKREAFCQARASGKTLDQAYAEAGYKPSRNNAARLVMSKEVKARLAELQAKVAEKYEVTVETMAAQFDEDRKNAIKWKQGSAAHAASHSKAKLFGLMVDKQSVNVTHNYSLMTEEELRFEIAAIHAEARSIKAGVQH